MAEGVVRLFRFKTKFYRGHIIYPINSFFQFNVLSFDRSGAVAHGFFHAVYSTFLKRRRLNKPRRRQKVCLHTITANMIAQPV